MLTISATELARNTRKILDGVTSRGEMMVIERNNVMIATIVPYAATMTAAQAIAGLSILTPEQASAWLNDSRGDFADGVRDPWA
jgi:antitoxin (DNA-binding transcriptional repressor) of toxin-antitoxin stability system